MGVVGVEGRIAESLWSVVGVKNFKGAAGDITMGLGCKHFWGD